MKYLLIALVAMVSLTSGALFANEGEEVAQPSTEQPTAAAEETAATEESNG